MELKDANLSGMEDHMFRPRETKGLCTPAILFPPLPVEEEEKQTTIN